MKRIRVYKTDGTYRYSLVDDADYPIISQYRWTDMKGEYARTWTNGETVLMHRMIMNPSKDMMVDHINHKKLDNRRENLRECTHSQNLANSVKGNKRKSSRYKGVDYKKRDKKWAARIMKDRKPHVLGVFDREIDAARAYDRCAVELFGEFANTNFKTIWWRKK
mgnify:CR=1 FL=1